ncbi:hypothetical protein [Methylorubrum aminovorans]
MGHQFHHTARALLSPEAARMFLLLSVCLIAQPAKCHEERINLSFDSPNTFICLRNSQSTLAAWQEEHPDYHVKSWRCAPKGSLPNDL